MSQTATTELKRSRTSSKHAIGGLAVLSLAVPGLTQHVRIGGDVAWLFDDDGSLMFVERHDAAKDRSERQSVGLRLDTKFEEAVQRRRGAWTSSVEFVRAASSWRWTALARESAWPMLLFGRGIGAKGHALVIPAEHVVEDAASEWLVFTPGVALRLVGFSRRGKRFEAEDDEVFVFATLSSDADEARLRTRWLRIAARQWSDAVATYDLLSRARLAVPLPADDALAAPYARAVRQLLDCRSTDQRRLIERSEDHGLRAAGPLAVTEAKAALRLAGFAAEADLLEAAPEACDADRFAAALASARAEAVTSFESLVRACRAGVSPERDRLQGLLALHRIPMLVEPADDRLAATLLLVGPGDSFVRSLEANVCANQARLLAEVLRPDGTLGWSGPLRPGAKPGPQHASNPLATIWLAEHRLVCDDVDGARRALEALEGVRAASGALGFGWHFDARSRDPMPESVRSAARFVIAVHALHAAEQRGVSKRETSTSPELLHFYPNDDARYAWAFHRAHAWCNTLARPWTKRAVEVRRWSRVLDRDQLAQETQDLLALSAAIEARFEASLRR